MSTSAPTEAPAPVHSRASSGRIDELTRLIAVLVIAASAIGRLAISLQSYYLLDDFAFIGRASRTDALALSTLAEPHLGHLMPAAHVAVWVSQTLAPWNFAVPALIMATGWLGCLVLMYRILTSWLGTAPVILVPLTVYAVTPVTIQATTWWAAALNAVPLQLCALGATLLLIPLVRGAPRLSGRRQLAILALTAVALAFFTKAVLLPILVIGVAIAWSPGRLRQAVRSALRAAPALWLGLIALVSAYALAYVVLVPTPPAPAGGAALVEITARVGQSVTGGLLPSAAGGPVGFAGGADPWSTPPLWVVGLGIAVTVAAIVGIVRGSPTTRRLAAVCLVYTCGCIALITVRQQGFFLLMAGSLRYFADVAVPAALLVASLTRDVLGDRPRQRTVGRWALIGAVLIGFCSVSLITTDRLADNPGSDAIRRTALASLDSVTREQQSPILDMWIPPALLTPLFYGDYARASVLYGAVPGAVRFDDQARALRLWAADGSLVPARVEGPVARGAPLRDGATCTQVRGSATELTLSAPVVPYTLIAELTTVATRPTTAQVSIGGTPSRTWEIPQGRATMYAWVTPGASRDVVVTPDDPDAAVCVVSLRVGNPVPSADPP